MSVVVRLILNELILINQRKSGQSVQSAFYQGFVRTFIFGLTEA